MRTFSALLIAPLALIMIAGCGDSGGGKPIVTPVTPPPPPKGADASRDAVVPSTDPYDETATEVAYMPQNWSADESLAFYFTPQGSQLIPYAWFLALEQPGSSTTPFR